jgi:hypothetical protein
MPSLAEEEEVLYSSEVKQAVKDALLMQATKQHRGLLEELFPQKANRWLIWKTPRARQQRKDIDSSSSRNKARPELHT